MSTSPHRKCTFKDKRWLSAGLSHIVLAFLQLLSSILIRELIPKVLAILMANKIPEILFFCGLAILSLSQMVFLLLHLILGFLLDFLWYLWGASAWVSPFLDLLSLSNASFPISLLCGSVFLVILWLTLEMISRIWGAIEIHQMFTSFFPVQIPMYRAVQYGTPSVEALACPELWAWRWTVMCSTIF